ncbi:DNA methyltransferase [Haliangium sp. UPWRP_2]|uniref:DNA methyltransferase n=1 Tax=Haliangium sp. UPWRP_2 TaxID=1931276 RepID=UPI00130505C1|nr:DNA methyltransferase [Haliangium sp. UPWRP_2]
MTGKPTAVMHFLARFVTPGGLILDPCAGSGSTGVGALLEGRRFVGIEQDEHYAQVAVKRLRETAEGRQEMGGGQNVREGAGG